MSDLIAQGKNDLKFTASLAVRAESKVDGSVRSLFTSAGGLAFLFLKLLQPFFFAVQRHARRSCWQRSKVVYLRCIHPAQALLKMRVKHHLASVCGRCSFEAGSARN